MAAIRVGTMAICPVMGIKSKAPLKAKISSKEHYNKLITFILPVGTGSLCVLSFGMSF